MTRMKLFTNSFVTILISLSLNTGTRCQQDLDADDLYSETPCELHPLSSYKDVQGNLWGVGDGNLWWFNSTNLSWSLLPLPNGTSAADPWKVACGDPKRYVSLLGPSGTLVLHLPWQHWQQVDAEEVNSGAVDPTVTWCRSGVLYATDMSKTFVYFLDHEEARWTLHSEITVSEEANDTKRGFSHGNDSHTWLLPSGEFVLLANQDSCTHIQISNSSALDWSIVKRRDREDPWPELRGKAITWVQEKDGPILWIWRTENATSIWAFNVTDLTWSEYSETEATFPKAEDILTTWSDNDQLCYVKRTETCTAQYSASSTICWNSTIAVSTTTQDLSTEASTNAAPQISATKLAPVPDNKSQTLRPIFISAHTVINKHSLLSALQSEVEAPDTSDEMPITVVVPSRHNPWHQHTSVFGSVIFFGTSLTIFGVVFTFWCMRRCVHFPKEALLLRDPPSVRYTAIPDNVPFDARGQPTTAYTVIPDSIA